MDKELIKTKPLQFIHFHELLMSSAPSDYVPWYFPVSYENKDPDGLTISKNAPSNIKGKRGNWKAPWARLSYEEALKRISSGINVGIAARKDDPLQIIDIDEWDKINQMPNTLIIKSRKRCGVHGYCWVDKEENNLPLNLPTDYGELRGVDQYVVAPGSYVTTSTNDINKENISPEFKEQIKKDEYLGVYTIHNPIQPIEIKQKQLPKFFLDHKKKIQGRETKKIKLSNKTIKPSGKQSALFDLTITNIISEYGDYRKPHPLHSSDTGKNFSVEGELAHCWRHLVSLNALQFLVVKSGYMSCQDAGTSHINGGAGSSLVIGDEGAIFHAWRQAKLDGTIPQEDPIPIRAMKFIGQKHLKLNSKDKIIPNEHFHRILKIVEDDY